MKLYELKFIIKTIIKEATAEEMLANKKTRQYIDDIGVDSDMIIDTYLAKTKNYKPNIYYHVENGSGKNYAGMGNGLYLGRDIIALKNFYDIEENLPVTEYKGTPKWIDLMKYSDLKKFELTCKKNKIRILNSNEVGEYVKSLGFDGIKYYDPQATGEEYVLFNTTKLKKTKVIT